MLSGFINAVTIIEETGKAEPEFWKAHDSLGNYLSQPLVSYKLQDTIVPFLREWNSYRTPIAWNEFARGWTADKQNVVKALSRKKLEDANSDNLLACARLFVHLLEVPGIGMTNASKLLALSLVDLCVRWDLRIIENFREGHPHRPGYLRMGRNKRQDLYYRFLLNQQEVANNLIQECMNRKRTTRDKAVKWLQQIPLRVPGSFSKREKPLAILLDECNYHKTR